MGTRGLYGFRKNDVDKTTYNHYDSYPSSLGNDIVDFIQSTSIEEMNIIYDKIILVNERDENCLPTDAELVEWKLTDKIGIGAFDWYSFLRGAQGDLDAYKGDLKYMIDNSSFIKDSLMCEWAYIINLDTNELEIYKGFQSSPSNSRYGNGMGPGNYYPCKLIKTYLLNNIPDNWLEEVEPDVA